MQTAHTTTMVSRTCILLFLLLATTALMSSAQAQEQKQAQVINNSGIVLPEFPVNRFQAQGQQQVQVINNSGVVLPEFPVNRFVPWSDLDETTKKYAETDLFYNQLTWNNILTASIERQPYSEIMAILGFDENFDYANNNNQWEMAIEAIEYIAIDGETWDCWINHYVGNNWEDLRDIHNVSWAFELLGWSESTWRSENETDWPESEQNFYAQLSPEERMGADRICCPAEIWDGVPIPRWEFDDNGVSTVQKLVERPWTDSPAIAPPNISIRTDAPTYARKTDVPIRNNSPSFRPTRKPPRSPTTGPSSIRGVLPPSARPTFDLLSMAGTEEPTLYVRQTDFPTRFPSPFPSINPSDFPSLKPSLRTRSPSSSPSESPSSNPTGSFFPSSAPSESPTKSNVPSSFSSVPPTHVLSNAPTLGPSTSPTTAPSSDPTTSPTKVPSDSPSDGPTKAPTSHPTFSPTRTPTKGPTSEPTKNPTAAPTMSPTKVPSDSPSDGPTKVPTSHPTFSPTKTPTKGPTSEPTKNPTAAPTMSPTNAPTTAPTTDMPSAVPTVFVCQVNFTLILLTDKYPVETTWSLSYLMTAEVIAEGKNYKNEFEEHEETVCLSYNSCYSFEIRDKWDDGICCGNGQGNYAGFLSYVNPKSIAAAQSRQDGGAVSDVGELTPIPGLNGGEFNDSEQHNFCLDVDGLVVESFGEAIDVGKVRTKVDADRKNKKRNGE